MPFTEKVTADLKQLKKTTPCRRNFECIDQEFKDTKHLKFSLDPLLTECLRENPSCKNAVPFADTKYCHCPVMLYARENGLVPS